MPIRAIQRNLRKYIDDNEQSMCLYFDTETTGLNRPEVIELCIIDENNHVVVDSYFKPKKLIEVGAMRVHGIDNIMLKDKPSFHLIENEIIELFSKFNLFAYNKNYDIEAIYNSTTPANQDKMEKALYRSNCLMQWFADEYNDGKWVKLAKACEYFCIPLENAHKAKNDTAVLVDLHRHLAWQ